MLGQWNSFARRAKKMTPAAIEHFTKEAVRLLHVLEGRLAKAPYLAQDYTIADIAAFTLTKAILPELKKDAGEELARTPSIDLWLGEIGARQAVARGLEVPKKQELPSCGHARSPERASHSLALGIAAASKA
jgi:GSH-dependent disulfide-bond oxidoreductase